MHGWSSIALLKPHSWKELSNLGWSFFEGEGNLKKKKRDKKGKGK